MLHCLLPFGGRPEDAPNWVRRWWTVSFLTAVTKLQDTMWKFDRAAGHAQNCRGSVQDWVEREARDDTKGISVNDPGFAAYQTALEDLPLYLDSLLLYLRIQADALAVVTPYLYEQSDGISFRSFRSQRAWFIEKNPNFDPIYAQILADNTQWFEELAGKAPSGLRDVIVHRGGTYQLGWTVPTEADRFQLQASMVNASGFVEDDVMTAIERMTHGWFRFLDLWCGHFTRKVAPVVSWADLERNDLARYVPCNGNELPSFWLYPRAA